MILTQPKRALPDGFRWLTPSETTKTGDKFHDGQEWKNAYRHHIGHEVSYPYLNIRPLAQP